MESLFNNIINGDNFPKILFAFVAFYFAFRLLTGGKTHFSSKKISAYNFGDDRSKFLMEQKNISFGKKALLENMMQKKPAVRSKLIFDIMFNIIKQIPELDDEELSRRVAEEFEREKVKYPELSSFNLGNISVSRRSVTKIMDKFK